VACLAFDSPGLSLIERGLACGRLPTLADLLDRGRLVSIKDRQEIVTSTSWPTLIRGCELSDHRLYADRAQVPGNYRIENFPAEAAARPPFWRYLSDAGVRSVVLSAYSAPLLDGFDGIQVRGWGSHDPFSGKLGLRDSDPAGLIEELDRRVGTRALRYDATPPRGERRLRAYVEDMIRGCDQQSQTLIHLLASTHWRFAFASFSECHQAGHWLWHLADAEHPDHDVRLPPDVRDGLMRVYEATDRALGAVVASLPADTVVLVISPYDMGPNHHLDEVIPAVLERGGWLVRPGVARLSPRVRVLRTGRGVVRALVPLGLRPALGRMLGRERLLAELTTGAVDWTSSAAMSVWTDGSAGLRLNLAGREPAGIVRPGGDAQRTLEELTAAMLDLRCADTGRRLVARVARYEDLFDAAPYSGPAELFVQWEHVQRPRAVVSERTGEIAVPAERSLRSVHHSPGFVLGAGPGIVSSGARQLRPVGEGRLADLGATVLALLGVPAPAEITGRPMRELVPAAAAHDV